MHSRKVENLEKGQEFLQTYKMFEKNVCNSETNHGKKMKRHFSKLLPLIKQVGG